MFKIGDIVLYRESVCSSVERAIIRREINSAGIAILWLPGVINEHVALFDPARNNFPSFTARESGETYVF